MTGAPARTGSPRLDTRAVALFMVVAFGGAWLVALPLWLSGRGLATPGLPVYLLAMMAMPTLATLVVSWRHRVGLAARTGLRAPGGIRSWLPWAALAWLAPLVLVALATLLSAAVGTFTADFVAFSGFREMVGPSPVPVTTLVLLQVVQVPVIGWLNVLPALGEEWGWRGWLLPALLPMGRWPAVLTVGVVWGLWHAPIVLLGYNYPGHAPVAAVGLMVVFCVVTGSLLGWLRLRSGSVWPCAIGHGFLNASAALPLLFVAAGTSFDNASTGLLGWPGWVVMALAFAAVAAALAAARSRATAPG
jgi:CAAX protease family protein